MLFPYPFAVRDGRIPTLTGLTLHPEDVLESARPGAVLLAGAGLEPCLEAPGARAKQFRLFLYENHPAFLDRNGDLSAEGALAQAMGRTGDALSDMEVLVTGYGRFGRTLAKKLKALGADVWVAARREEQRLAARSDGMRAMPLSQLPDAAAHVSMVLNTIPAHVLGTEALAALPKGTWLLELASAPYGFDRDRATALGLNVEVLPALPSRYAPQSAARALKQVSLELLREASI